MEQFKKIGFYYRHDISKAVKWEVILKKRVKAVLPHAEMLEANRIPLSQKDAPDLLLILGGDGTILEAAQKFERWRSIMCGLNFGHVGFLATIRNWQRFMWDLEYVLKGDIKILERMMIRATVTRNKKKIYDAHAMNDITIKSLTGVVNISVSTNNDCIRKIRGDGVIIATPTGATAYNLSAHGPIVMPDIKCFIITELMNHGVPIPSIVMKRNRVVTVTIDDFRETDLLLMRRTSEPVDVIATADYQSFVPLKKGDTVVIKRSERLVRFAELDENYFFKSLAEKFHIA